MTYLRLILLALTNRLQVKPAPCKACDAKDFVIGEIRRLLEEERAARADDRRVLLETLKPGIVQRLETKPAPRPAVVVPEPPAPPQMPEI